MDHLPNTVSKYNRYPAKSLWPDWPDNVWNQPSGQVKMAGLAGKWPDMGMNLLPIAVFSHKSLLPAFSILSYRRSFFYEDHPIGHSIGHFVLDNSFVLKRHFYRTFSLNEPMKSYLIDSPSYILNLITSHCISAVCLFDGYLIEALYRDSKTPKPLDQSGFFPPLPLGQRDMSKVAIFNI